MRTLALIPARAGSKGIPGKNTRNFVGDPLFLRACRVADLAGVQRHFIVVSTDDEAIRERALGTGYVGIRRPPELATDEASMLAVVRHAVHALRPHGFDVVALLQPTQPLRKPEHIRAALKMLEETGADSVVSVVEIPGHYSPDYAMRIDAGRLEPFDYHLRHGLTSRQDARPAYSRDGTVYAIRRETIEAGLLYGKDCRALIIPSNESVNLDTEEDWTLAEARMNGRK